MRDVRDKIHEIRKLKMNMSVPGGGDGACDLQLRDLL